MKHGDFDLRLHSYEPRRLLPQLPLRTSRQLFLRCSMINRSPRFALRYVQTHWKKTLNRKLLAPFTPIVHVYSAERPNST
jgi:hypothetical protein